MLNSPFSKKALRGETHSTVLELNESRTKTHFHHFGGINVHATPQGLQYMFLATTLRVFLKSTVNQQSMALYWGLRWR